MCVDIFTGMGAREVASSSVWAKCNSGYKVICTLTGADNRDRVCEGRGRERA
jgi:hypothetical protein